MIKYLKTLLLTSIITIILTCIYFFIDFEFPNLFYNKLQITMIPGLIYIYIAIKSFTGVSLSPKSDGIYIASRSKIEIREDRDKFNNNADREENIKKIAYLTSGIIQLIFGILIGKIGVIEWNF